MAVRKAVSAATRTFTANSMIRCFFIRFVFFRGMSKEEGEYSGGEYVGFLCGGIVCL